MAASTAWKRHGCYRLGSLQFYNMPLDKSLLGCEDDWNALDHFDPSTGSRRIFTHFNSLRTTYGALQDGFNLVQRGNWTYRIEKPGSNHTFTEMGLWSVSRSAIENVQTLSGTFNDQVWLLYTNENQTKSWEYDCSGDLWISSPFQSGTTVRNLFAPFETYTLEDSLSSYFNNGEAPWFGCLSGVTMDAYGFKALVPEAQWVAAPVAITKFSPGHDHRLLVVEGDNNSTNIDISLEFNVPMDCDGVTNSLTLEMDSSGHGSAPTISNVNCAAVTGATSDIQGGSASAWAWSATLTNFPDGILKITVDNPASAGGNTTNVRDIHFFILLLTSYSSLSIISCSGKEMPAMSWSGQSMTTILLVPSRRPTMDTPLLTWPMAQRGSDIHGTLVKTGRLGRNGKIQLQSRLASSVVQMRTICSGMATTSWCNVNSISSLVEVCSNFFLQIGVRQHRRRVTSSTPISTGRVKVVEFLSFLLVAPITHGALTRA